MSVKNASLRFLLPLFPDVVLLLAIDFIGLVLQVLG